LKSEENLTVQLHHSLVIPAKAGIHANPKRSRALFIQRMQPWIPAFAGMTEVVWTCS
jgi:hypothetical protein